MFLQELENTDDVDEAWKAAFLKTDDLLEESKILYSGLLPGVVSVLLMAARCHCGGGFHTRKGRAQNSLYCQCWRRPRCVMVVAVSSVFTRHLHKV